MASPYDEVAPVYEVGARDNAHNARPGIILFRLLEPMGITIE